MCGILGISSAQEVIDPRVLASMRDTMDHRGPDDAGVWISPDQRVGLAHRRLAIIDLSPGGHQPMRDVDGRVWVTFNGEIYNYQDLRRELEGKGHRFHTASDTEVLIASYLEWGTDCLAHLNGMFVFGLYDMAKMRIFIARDRAGEKPLFYRLDKQSLTFASELKALMADPGFSPRLCLEALDCYLDLGYVPGDHCILQGIKKLPPAHALTFDLEDASSCVWRYWHLPHPLEETTSGNLRVDEGTLLEELEALLEDAVKRQLVADVPIGVLLSGGVDSSLTTAMAARVSPDVKTFTIRFPGHDVFDETEHARLVARHFNTEHMELEAEPSSVELLPLLASQFDEPIIDSSMIPMYLVSKLVRQHCTVALGGDGGDELFGGYWHYNRLLWLQSRLGRFPLFFRKAIAKTASVLPVGFKGRNWLQGLGVDLNQGVPQIASYFDSDVRKQLLKPEVVSGSHFGKAAVIRQASIPQTRDLLQRATRLDFENYLAEDILVKVDRASMLNSLELRAPLLDYRIIEFAFGKVPSYLKTTTNNRKILLKKLSRQILPSEFDLQRKQGFSIPLSTWLQEPKWGDYFKEILLESRDSLFERRFVSRLLSNQTQGRLNNSERLFALVMFELWRNQYRISY